MCSEIRQIPDHQEVFLNQGDESLIIEVLEMQQNESIEGYFANLADDNETTAWEILGTERVTNTTLGDIFLLRGVQKILKWGRLSDVIPVNVDMALVRLPEVNVDLLISLNQGNANILKEIVKSLKIKDYSLFQA